MLNPTTQLRLRARYASGHFKKDIDRRQKLLGGIGLSLVAQLADQLAMRSARAQRKMVTSIQIRFQIIPKLRATARVHEIATGASEKGTNRCGAFPNSKR